MIKRTIFLMLMIGLVIALLLQTQLNTAKPVFFDKNQSVFVELTGYSMYPTIKDGETKPCEVESDYCVGDVVAFQCKNQIVSHRIVGEIFGRYVTQGDNNIMPDLGLVTDSEILCKVELNQTIL
jgi:signal peptidase I